MRPAEARKGAAEAGEGATGRCAVREPQETRRCKQRGRRCSSRARRASGSFPPCFLLRIRQRRGTEHCSERLSVAGLHAALDKTGGCSAWRGGTPASRGGGNGKIGRGSIASCSSPGGVELQGFQKGRTRVRCLFRALRQRERCVLRAVQSGKPESHGCVAGGLEPAHDRPAVGLEEAPEESRRKALMESPTATCENTTRTVRAGSLQATKDRSGGANTTTRRGSSSLRPTGGTTGICVSVGANAWATSSATASAASVPTGAACAICGGRLCTGAGLRPARLRLVDTSAARILPAGSTAAVSVAASPECGGSGRILPATASLLLTGRPGAFFLANVRQRRRRA
jgi:hypothetical protein